MNFRPASIDGGYFLMSNVLRRIGPFEIWKRAINDAARGYCKRRGGACSTLYDQRRVGSRHWQLETQAQRRRSWTRIAPAPRLGTRFLASRQISGLLKVSSVSGANLSARVRSNADDMTRRRHQPVSSLTVLSHTTSAGCSPDLGQQRKLARARQA